MGWSRCDAHDDDYDDYYADRMTMPQIQGKPKEPKRGSPCFNAWYGPSGDRSIALQLMPCMDQEHTDHLDGVLGLHVQKPCTFGVACHVYRIYLP